MYLKFSYKDIPGWEISENNVAGIFEPRKIFTTNPREKIVNAIENPLGTLPLEQIVSKNMSITILVDDNTRLTPTDIILDIVTQKIMEKGVNPTKIKILVASGTHRAMTKEEKIKKYGAAICSKFEILDHNWSDKSQIVSIGTTKNGTIIEVNKHALECDLLIGIGSIVPHRVAGFSGGGKIVQPGVGGSQSTGKTHWLSAIYKGEEILGKAHNPVRDEITYSARKVGLDFIINTILDSSGKLVDVVAGDLETAYLKGTEISTEVYGVEVEKADIVITESYPADIEMWQAAKGIYSADLAVKDGGTIILVTPCPEGVSVQHKDIIKYGYRPFEEVNSLVEKNILTDLTVAAHLVHVGEVIKNKARCILVSPGIDKETAEHIGFIKASTIQEAVDMSLDYHGKDTKCLILRHGGDIFPIIK